MANSSDTSFYGAATDEWIGRVLPYDSQKLQQNGAAGFGIRRRVAIMGCHPSDNTISNEEIVFALVVLPTTAGSGAAGKKSSVRVTQGDVVMGKFLDGENRQNPIITGVLGRTEGAKNEDDGDRFTTKTWFVGSEKITILNPNKQEYNTDNPQSTPRAIPSSNKKNTTSSRSSENLKKSGIQTNKVGSLPPAKENALPVDEDGNSTLDQKTKDKINDFFK